MSASLKPDSKQQIQGLVRKLISLIVQKDYFEIVTLTRGRRLNEEEIGNAIAAYGATITEPPASFYNNLDIVETDHTERSEWSVWLPLWTKEDESDLTVQITIFNEGDGLLQLELDDIHTL